MNLAVGTVLFVRMFPNFEGKTFNVKNYFNCTTANEVYVYFVSIVTNVFTSEKPGTPCTKDIC